MLWSSPKTARARVAATVAPYSEGHAARSRNEISEQEAEAALHFIDERRGHDPVVAMLDEAALDDEPTMPEEDAGAAEARAEYESGVFFDSDEIKRELG